MKNGADLRCDYRKHAELLDGRIEIRCRKPQCGYAPGVLVIHVFDPETGNLVDTKRFREPPGESNEEGRE